MTLRWLATQRRVANAHVKRVCYLSVEYLPGPILLNALYSLEGDLVHEARATLRQMGYELEDIAEQEVDPGLGNGGLGRLAACFPDLSPRFNIRQSVTASGTTTASSRR